MPSPNSGETGGGEFAAIERLAAVLGERFGPPPPGALWVGDDAAVAPDGPDRWRLLTTDMAVAGVHGDLALMSLADFGWRALVAAVSDIAAMGGTPHEAVVAVGAPSGTDLDTLYDGVADAAKACGCPVVGGDLASAPVLTLAVAVTGLVSGAPPPVTRAGASAGDHIFVTGELGASSAGLRLLRAGHADDRYSDRSTDAHLRPMARLAEGDAARRAGATAMIDVSDGLVAELDHIASASGLGWCVDEVPAAPGATLDEATTGGEDYELVVVTADSDTLLRSFRNAGLRRPVLIGLVEADASARSLLGHPAPAAGGWEHRFGP